MENYLTKDIDVDKIRQDINSKILSMSEIARQMGISKAQLSKFLNGKVDNVAMILRCKAWLEKANDN